MRSYYKEYPVRCKTCNEPIAAFSITYEGLLRQGWTREDALNEIGILLPCSRNAMMNPTNVFFNMESREAILGIQNVEAAKPSNKAFIDLEYANFNPCHEKVEERRKFLRSLPKEEQEPEESDFRIEGEDDDVYSGMTTSNTISFANLEVPTKVGAPTYNNTGMKPEWVYVGAGKRMCKMLPGRTFLAR